MSSAFAFDVYGTLIDPAGVVQMISSFLGEAAIPFSNKWRSTQINYSLRRSILDEYAPFTQCTRDALEATCEDLNVKLSQDQKEQLMQKYLELPTFPGVEKVLSTLSLQGDILFAFSNGADSDLEALFQFAGIRKLFTELISVGPTKKFKPDPFVYAHLKEKVGENLDRLIFVSANPFDVQGARKANIKVAWLNRQAVKKFDPWGPQPSIEIENLDVLTGLSLGDF